MKLTSLVNKRSIMKKILVRAGMSPFINTPIEEIIAYNRIGNNVGNLVYASSIYRALMTENTVVEHNSYRHNVADADYINENYSAFVIPLADAFRESFVNELVKLTNLIKKLTIPCIVVGVGVRADYDYKNKGLKFKHDEVAIDFIKAVLEKSALIGLRGEITAEFFNKLGFVAERDYTVIGCPSLYKNGENLDVKEINLEKIERLAVNNTVMSSTSVQKFLSSIFNEYRGAEFYPQRLDELRTLYLGEEYIFKRKCPGYPKNTENLLYRDDRVRFFTNVEAWINSLSENDLSIGPRLHGNVAAVIAGTPAIWIMHDARMKELVDYHNLPHIYQGEIAENHSLLELLEKIDYKKITMGHRERFMHYVDFLNKNGLENIFKDYKNIKNSPYDIKVGEIKKEDYSVKSVVNCSLRELAKRYSMLIDCEKNKVKEALEKKSEDKDNKRKEEINRLKEELIEREKELKEAKNKPFFVFRRKVGKIVKRIKNISKV